MAARRGDRCAGGAGRVVDDVRRSGAGRPGTPPRHRQRESEGRARAGRERSRDVRREPRRAVAHAVGRGCRHAQRKHAINARRRTEHAEPVQQPLRGGRRELGGRPVGQAVPGQQRGASLVSGERRRPCRGEAVRPGHAGADLLPDAHGRDSAGAARAHRAGLPALVRPGAGSLRRRHRGANRCAAREDPADAARRRRRSSRPRNARSSSMPSPSCWASPPSTFEIARSGKLPTVPAVPQMLPATLLERRPDIAAAQRRVAAAYWQIGVADAAFFPPLTLSASATYRNSVHRQPVQRAQPVLVARAIVGARDPRRRSAPARERAGARRRRSGRPPTIANRC